MRPVVVLVIGLVISTSYWAILPENANADVINTMSDGKTSREFVFEYPHAEIFSMKIPKDVDILESNIRVKGMPYISEPGTEFERKTYPTNVYVDIGKDGSKDWKFDGKLGHLTNFVDETNTSIDSVELKWTSPGAQTASFWVPKSKILSAEITINNTDTTRYRLSASIGGKNFWIRDSLGFTYLDIGYAKDTLTYVILVDIDLDLDLDIVAASSNGRVYVAKNNGMGEFPNATAVEIDIEGNSRELLHVAAGNLDDDSYPDIAIAGADGNIYYCINGGGTFLGSQVIITNVNTRMCAVTIEDVDNDGTEDIVGGALNGNFYIARNDGGGYFESEIIKVRAGTGAMNDVTVVDLDMDDIPDIVGANNDQRFYFARGTGGKDLFEDGKPITVLAHGNLKSVEAYDIDGDDDLDLMGACGDGSIYIAWNLGNNQGGTPGEFDSSNVLKLDISEERKGGLKLAKLVDLNGDGSLDILALGSTKEHKMYGFLNDGMGNMNPDYQVLFSAGQSASAFDVGRLDKDGDADVCVGCGMKFYTYSNNMGKFTENIKDGEFLRVLQSYIDGAKAVDDGYGNQMIEIVISIKNDYIGKMSVESLNITYDYEVVINTKDIFQKYINTHDAEDDGKVKIPIEVYCGSYGILNITGVYVEYQMGMALKLLSPLNGTKFNDTDEIPLKGATNNDPEGSIFNYTWFFERKGKDVFIGYGSSQSIPARTLRVGLHTIKLVVRDLEGRTKEDTVEIEVVTTPYAKLKVTEIIVTPSNPTENEEVEIKITIQNTGTINATNVGFRVYVDSNKTSAVGSDMLPVIPKDEGKATSIVSGIYLDPGDHRIFVEIVACDQKYEQISSPAKLVSVKSKQANYSIIIAAFGVIGLFGMIGLIAYRIKKKKDIEEEEMEKSLKLAEELKHKEYESLYGTTPSAKVSTAEERETRMIDSKKLYSYESYETPSYDYASVDYDSYSAESYSYGEADGIKAKGYCPRCGKPSEFGDADCHECRAKDKIDSAEQIIKEAYELALDIDSAEALLESAKASLEKGKVKEALEDATRAEEIATKLKESFDKVSAYALGEADLTAELEEEKKKGPRILAPKFKCPKCGADVEKGWKVCPSCKSEIGEINKCPSCNADIKPNWKICPKCRFKLQ